jgi:peptidoglycan/xylan/chitin deacetylase (PgdA/CDA1 family)
MSENSTRRLNLNALAGLTGAALPRSALEVSVGAALAGLGVSLCLHRVGETRRPSDWQPGLCIAPSTLDDLVELLLSKRPGSSANWLSLSFDDGYRDAAEYIRSRAARFPAVEFFFFVCPQKLERRVGFRWDVVEQRLKNGEPRDTALKVLDAPHLVASENARNDLQGLADGSDFAMVDLAALRALAAIPNVIIGNHSTMHASPRSLSTQEAALDYRTSRDDFERLVGPQKHFAFPFGTPRHHVEQRHVDVLRKLGDFMVWTTEARPYRFTERRPGAVLPRFPIDGLKPATELAGWIAARSLAFRLRGTKHRYS